MDRANNRELNSGKSFVYEGVRVDSDSEFGLRGLSTAALELLRASGISRKEVLRNSAQILGLLSFHFDGKYNETGESLVVHVFLGPVQMPSKLTVDKEMREALKLKSDDPFRYYKKNKLLGEGGLGKVFKCTDKKTGKPCALKSMDISDLDTVCGNLMSF